MKRITMFSFIPMDLPTIEGFRQIARYLNIRSTVRLSSTCKDLRHYLYRPLRAARDQELKERLSWLYLKNRLGPKLYERKKWLLKVFDSYSPIEDLSLIYGITVIFRENVQGYALRVLTNGNIILYCKMDNLIELKEGEFYAFTIRDFLYTNPIHIHDLKIEAPSIHKIVIGYDDTIYERYRSVQIYNYNRFDEIWYYRPLRGFNNEVHTSREFTMKKTSRTKLKDYMKTYIIEQ